ncbi:hypothetical protein [Mycobacterium kyorinense]|uniref:Uncharacterized protein n=1 Tax=Mycobacterium kyorinense TaxID=487514 RepID=A0A1X1Y483_9MYCO|nr:hypothetical protein [Mycobacterium kyorinense]ORW05932.1 hypothetical protein AWC14_26400 [Mycobacterium kyorinense]
MGATVAGDSALPSLSELRAWPTDHFNAIADWCDAEADRWENSFTEAHKQVREADWEGQAHDQAMQRMETDLAKARGGGSALRDTAKILRIGGENEGFAKAALLRAVNEAKATGYVVGENLSFTDTVKYTSWDQAQARRALAREFAAETHAQAASLMRIDQDIAKRLPPISAALRGVRFAPLTPTTTTTTPTPPLPKCDPQEEIPKLTKELAEVNKEIEDQKAKLKEIEKLPLTDPRRLEFDRESARINAKLAGIINSALECGYKIVYDPDHGWEIVPGPGR